MYKRRHYFIDKRFQFRFILIYCLSIIVWSLLNGIALYHLVSRRIEAAYYSSHLDFTATGEIILPVIIRVNLISALIIFLFAILVVLLYMKKMENYLINFKDAVVKVTEGDLSAAMPVTHIGDVIDNVSSNFNEMVTALKGSITDIRRCVNILGEKIKTLDDAVKRGSVSEIEDAIGDIKTASIEAKTHFSRFEICG